MTPPYKPCYLCGKQADPVVSRSAPICRLCNQAQFEDEKTEDHEPPKPFRLGD